MSDQLAPQAGDQPEDEKPTPPAAPPDNKSDWKDAEIEKARREAAKRRVENKDLKAELDAIKPKLAVVDALQEQVTKLATLLEKAEAARIQSELNTARTAAAAKYNLPPELAKRVQGATAEEMDADARALADAIPKPKLPGSRYSPGNSGNAVNQKSEVDQVVEKIRGRKTGPSEASEPSVHKAKGGGVVGVDTE